MYCVYVLQDQLDKGLYIGFTENLRRRLQEHQTGKEGATTKKKYNWRLIYCEGYLNKYDALGREKFLKGGSGRKYLKKQLKYYLELESCQK